MSQLKDSQAGRTSSLQPSALFRPSLKGLDEVHRGGGGGGGKGRVICCTLSTDSSANHIQKHFY